MLLFVDKYRPRELGQLDFHAGILARLELLAQLDDFPHLLVYGPLGGGKKTRVLATLAALYGSGVERMKIDVRQFATPLGRKLEFNVVLLPHHLEVTPSDMGTNDRVVMQDLLKEVAQLVPVDFSGTSKFKVVVVNEADRMTRDAQAALRRTMEKYLRNIRLVLVATSIANIIPPIQLRCLMVRVPAPSETEIAAVLAQVTARELLAADPAALSHIAGALGRNLRRALLQLEALTMHNEVVAANTPLVPLDWEVVVREISSAALREQLVAQLQKSRPMFYDLIAHCIPPRTVLRQLAWQLVEGTQLDSRKQALVALAADYDERLSLGQKAIFHLEGFLANAMVVMEK